LAKEGKALFVIHLKKYNGKPALKVCRKPCKWKIFPDMECSPINFGISIAYSK